MKLAALVTIMLFLCIPAVSAFTVEGYSIDQTGSLTPNTPVTISFKVGFSASSDLTFPASSDLVLETDLTNPKWTYTVILNDVENARNPESGKKLELSGFEISYPSKIDESIRVTLEGTTPTVDTTTEKVMLNVHEVDTHGSIITSTMVNKTALIINTGDVTKVVSDKNTNLQSLRSHIDEKSAIGVDTSEAETYYNDAQSKISTASSLPAAQYTEALNDLVAAQTSIDAGEKAVDKAWAENEVANAQVPINNVDNVIAWFKGNKSTSDDTQLPAIVAKRESAVNYLSTANDEIANGNYEMARNKAAEAFSKGNESYTDALTRKSQLLTAGFQLPIPTLPKLPGGIFLIVGVIIVILAVVGIIIYRKRSRWDELG